MGASSRKQFDWDAIEVDYRAGMLSNCEIARRHGCAEGSIRKHAKKHGWEKDLTAKVQQKVRATLVRDEARKVHVQATEQEIVEAAGETGAAVVRSHRTDITDLRDITARLRLKLHALMGEDANLDNMAKMYDAAQVTETLTRTCKHLITLERQAFNLDAKEGQGQGDTVPVEDRIKTYTRRELIEQSDGKVADLDERRAATG